MYNIELSQIKSFITAKYPDSSNVQSIGKGEMSDAYKFQCKGVSLIFRINKTKVGFNKDQMAYINFSKSIPIPKIFEIGEFADGLYYSISECAIGESLNIADHINRRTTIDSLFETLDAIHALEPAREGYGMVKEDGSAYAESWGGQIAFNHGEPDSWIEASKRLPTIKDVDFLKKINQDLLDRIKDLPNLRNVIHGDFGYGNLFFSKNKVSAVIDWATCSYGDPLYDVARLHFWYSDKYVDYFDEYQKRHPKTEDYRFRIEAYLIDIGLGSIYHAGKRSNHELYESSISRLREKL